jgi:hypothetical protein
MMNLEKRIERLEHAVNATSDHIHMVFVPYVADDAGRREARRQALERNSAPNGTKLTVCLMDYASMEL